MLFLITCIYPATMCWRQYRYGALQTRERRFENETTPGQARSYAISWSRESLRWRDNRTHRGNSKVALLINCFNICMIEQTWYLVFSHLCNTTDFQMSPQSRLCVGCGDIWKYVVSQPWLKTMYQFLQHGRTSRHTQSKLLQFKSTCRICLLDPFY